MNDSVQLVKSHCHLVHAAFNQLPDPVLLVDDRQRIGFINTAAEKLLGVVPDNAVGRELACVLSIFGAEASQRLSSLAGAALRWQISQSGWDEHIMESDGGWQGVMEVYVAPLPDSAGHSQGAMLMFRDITTQWSRTNELHYQATHDALTGLINRREFEQKLTEFLQHTRETGVKHALCFIDLNNFKTVNDRHGHVIGDKLLQELSKYMLGQLRKGDVLGRLGGDEFGLILGSCSGAEAMCVAQSVQRAIAAFRFRHHDQLFQVTAGIGVTDVSGANMSVQYLVDAADKACYAAKQNCEPLSSVVHSNYMEVIARSHTPLNLNA